MPTRRHIFQLLAAAPVLASAGCSGLSETPDPYAAWRQPGQGEADPRRFVLAHGLLAPNPHNRQPCPPPAWGWPPTSRPGPRAPPVPAPGSTTGPTPAWS